MSRSVLSGVAVGLGLALLTTGSALGAAAGLLALSLGLVGVAAAVGQVLGREQRREAER